MVTSQNSGCFLRLEDFHAHVYFLILTCRRFITLVCHNILLSVMHTVITSFSDQASSPAATV